MNKLSFVTAFALLTVACSSSSSGDGGTSSTQTDPKAVPSAVLIVGSLADSDMSVAEGKHDAAAKAGEPTAKMLGDGAHTVMLGTTLLGTTKNQFLALDRWSDGTNIDAFYGSKDFQSSLAPVFSAPPSTIVFVAQPGWSTYGTPDGANADDPHYWVIVRGTMKSSDAKTNQMTHDGIASVAAPQAQAAGDLAHVVYTGRDDVKQFLAVDVWPASKNIESFYGNPDVQKAFSQLFEGPPSISVYSSTNWYQW